VLTSLSFDAHSISMIQREGGVQTVIDIMRKHSQSIEVVRNALRLLCNLSTD
ncbi:hypothetical protein KIPB_016766, partial [Kipferlia bialata]